MFLGHLNLTHKKYVQKGEKTMNKTVKKVFVLIGILVGIFIAWQLIFNDGGILKTGYNALAKGINKQWEKVAGKGETILALWSDKNATSNGEGFTINTSK